VTGATHKSPSISRRNRASEECCQRTAGGPFLGLCGSELGRCLDERRIRAEGAERRLVAGVDHGLGDADEFTRAGFILAGEREAVARGERGRELVPDLEGQVGAGNLEPVLGREKLGIGERHARAAPAPDVEPLIDRDRRFEAV
jgi:hypothetical protein